MAFRTIVTILDVPQNAGIASDIAFSLAAGNNSHVIGLHAEIVSPVPMVAPMESRTRLQYRRCRTWPVPRQ